MGRGQDAAEHPTQCTGQLPTTKSYPTQSISSDVVEEPCPIPSDVRVFITLSGCQNNGSTGKIICILILKMHTIKMVTEIN